MVVTYALSSPYRELLKVPPDWSHERIRGIDGFSTRRHASLYILQKRRPFFGNQPAVLGRFVKSPHTQKRANSNPLLIPLVAPTHRCGSPRRPLRIPARHRAPCPPPRPMGRGSRRQRLTGRAQLWPRAGLRRARRPRWPESTTTVLSSAESAMAPCGRPRSSAS